MADTQYWPLQHKQQSASDIRKVIANATKTTWKWFTIANNDELKEQKEKKEQKQVKVSTPSWTVTRTNTNVETPKVEASTVKETPQWPTPFPVIDKSQLTWDIFKNPQLQWIKNIPTFQEDNQAEHNVASRNNNDESFMNTFWRATELKKPVDVDNALMDLFVDVRWKVKSWTLAQSDVVKMKELYPEFANMWDDVILSMIWDMASIANKNMPFNNENMAKFKSLYPELTAASWWFDKWSSENMYQAWWMREQMAQSSKTDLNRFWTAWAVAEWIMNPLWEVTTLADMWAQMIPQVDGSWNENRLKKALSKLTDEDINKYYEQYQNYVKNHWTLSNLYTLQLEWDTVVEQLWNWATGKWKKDVDAWFRDWLIDRVNNEVNWWAWEVTWAANDLKWVWWPNIAKMYANMPASTVKTITAITRAITNPVDTAAWLYHLFWTEEGRQALIARYGSWDWFAKALEQDPVWVASDWLAIVEWWAWLTKMAAWWLSKASLLAWLSTEALWAARTTENLLKLATRLENMAIKAGKVEKTAWLASNIGVDLPINKVINWLKTWWESWESLIQKAAKYTANKATTWVWTIAGKVVDTGKDIIKKWPINSLADLLMGSATDSDKLFKAASPNINRLSNNVDYKNKRAKMDLAEQAIVDAWYLPKSISEWAKAHTETLNKKWNEFKQMVADKWDVLVDVKDILQDVKNYIKSEKEWATELQKQDLRKLEVEVNALERMWKVDMNFIEKRKEHYNSSWRDSDKLKVWDVYLKGIKMIGNAMRKQQDNILGKWPESTKKLRSEIAALMDTKNDVIKADIRNQKKKSDISWGGLVESYWRLSWLWDVIWWVVWWVLGKWWEWFAQAWKWLGKMVLWKAMGRAKDVDYLTKKGFEWLSKKKKAQNSAWLQSKFKDSKELWNLYVERDNLRKELKKDNISDSRKEEINKRLDDIEYAIAQKKARAWLWDKERVLSEENKKKVIDMVSKRAKDVWFTTEVLDWMEKDTQGYTDLRKKLIALEKNPWDTTAQHELFHAFFSVVDNKTKTYILDEAKKILKDSWMKDVNAEEWLAESFGIYAKRKQIKLWLIDAPKGFVAKVRNFFQKVYEFMQRFNGDRATINKVFDEVLWDRQMKNWIIDLSDLLGDKEVKARELWDNWLRNKAVYHGSPADFDKFDSSHMWEGEGAQAHWWGHYVAVEKGTAEWYANWGKNEIKIKWKSLKDERARLSNPTTDYNRVKGNLLYDIEYELSHWHKTKEDIERAINKLKLENKHTLKSFQEELEDPTKSQALRNLWYSEKEIKENTLRRITEEKIKQKILDKITTDDVVVNNAKRNLYNIEIPDPKKAKTPTWSNYWEEDAMLWKKEIDKLADELDKYADKNKGKFEYIGRMRYESDANSLMYYDIKEEAKLLRRAEMWKWKVIFTDLENIFWEKWASKFLESIWYDGIHYYWWRDWEAYVIFNDDALQIKDHIRYKKKIWDKDVEITPKVKSPNELIEKNADWLSVMKSFISEKQAEKALNVSKDILDKDGNPYLWTHTNKYDALQFANFENTMDSKYKWYTDQWKEIAWVTNSEDMSRSYADQKSVLANTKSFKNVEDFNNHFKENPVKGGKTRDWMEKVVNVKLEKEKLNWEDIWVLKQQTNNVWEYNKLKDLWDKAWQENWVEEYKMPKDEIEAMNKIKNAIKNEYRYTIDDVKIEKKDGKYVLEEKFKPFKADTKVYWWRDEKEAIANAFRFTTKPGQYHYQGILQDMKNPLVVDIRNPDGSMTNWSRLWTVDEMFKKEWIDYNKNVDFFIRDVEEAMDWFTNRMKALEDYWNNAYRDDPYSWPSQLIWNVELAANQWVSYMVEELWNLVDDVNLSEDTKKALNQKVYWDLAEYWDTLKDAILELKDYMDTDRNYLALNNLSPDWISKWVRDMWAPAVLQKMMKGKHWKDLLNTWRDVWDKTWRENIKEQLTTNWMWLETNDWVKYALDKWWYDWVIFKQISDYWGNSNTHKWWDVVAMFNSKQFKAWDNANPTDSKYISYKKKVSLDKKSEWLQKKNSSWLLAKGRERMWDNGMRYKKEVPEDKKLIWLHNLNINKLKWAIELWGMPMPSIAVTKKWVPHESYWDITFIMKESAINPALSRKNKLYTVDWYTPTAPQTITKVKNTKEADALMDKIQKETWIWYWELMQWLEYHDERYFEDYPKLKKFDKYYDQLTEKKLWWWYTPSGKRKYLDYNLDNLVKQMTWNKRNAFNGSYWKMVAQSQGTATIDKLRERKYWLKNEEAANQLHTKYFDAIADLYEKVWWWQWAESLTDYWRFADEIADAYRPNTDAWFKELTQWEWVEGTKYAKIKKEDLQKLQDIVKEWAELARPYSEAKPERAIRFDEVWAVVAPEGKLKEVKDMLKYTWLKVYWYKEGERMSVVDKVADDNGLRFKKGYHGSKYDFDKFSSEHIWEGEGNQAHGYWLYIAWTKKTAKWYAQMWGNPRLSYKWLNRDELADRLIDAKLDWREYPDSIANAIITRIEDDWLSFKEAKKEAIKTFSNIADEYKANGEMDKYNATKKEIWTLEWLKRKDFEMKKWRHLYTVDIPDVKDANTPSWKNYLNEEKLYWKKVYEKIFEEARKNPNFVNEKGFDYYINDKLKFRGKNQMYWVWINKALESWFWNNQKAVAEFLKWLWYEGIEYKGLQDGKAYVIFDDKNIDIKDHIRYKKQTQTPEFKKWFEGSKVVDKSWKPLEVYHGSRHAWFTEFKPVNSFEDWLYFFSNKRHIASYFWWWDTLWSDKWLQGKFDEAKAKWIDEVKKFAKRYFNTPQEIEVSMNHITPKEAKEFWVEPWYFYHIDDWQVASPIRINWKRTFDKPLSQKEIDDAILREVQSSVDYYWAEDKKKSQVYASYLDIKNPLEVEAKWNKFSHVLNPIDWQYHHVADIAYMAKENWYDWVIIKDVSESPEKDLRWDDYIVWDSRQIKSATDNIWTFDKNNPDIRYKKWLQKKADWLEKKKTSSIGRHLEDIDRIASKLWVKWDNAIQKIKKMNKVIKDPKYQGTKIKKELYDLKWEIKKNYIIDNNKKIKDRWFRKTTVKIWNWWESAEWHFTKKQYDELKKLWYIVK